MDTEVAVIGAGAAGIGAARRLAEAGIAFQVLEARGRIGGRAWSVPHSSGDALDLGCGWLHSADRNPWRKIARAAGMTIDKTPPPWRRQSGNHEFSAAEQKAFGEAIGGFFERVDKAAEEVEDRAAAKLLESGSRWNPLIDAVSSWMNGAETDRLSVKDFGAYDDSWVNWRLKEGYGTLVANHGQDIPVTLDCPVTEIDRRGPRLRLETGQGPVTADAVIVTLPTNVIAEEGVRFLPALPEKLEAASDLPLGLADKLFLTFRGVEELEADGHFFGRRDRTETGSYHLRPFGRPMVEVFFGGRFAAELEREGEAAFTGFAAEELAGLLGNSIRKHLTTLAVSLWQTDPFSLGSYSHALPGKADARARLAMPVEGRLYFAGEACSPHDFSTAHGALQSGIAAADQLLLERYGIRREEEEEVRDSEEDEERERDEEEAREREEG